MIEIVATGPQLTVQDLGRARWAALGVPRSGAFDRGAARLANRLVGNPVGAALFEVTFGGLVFRALDATTVALTGARCAGLDWGMAVTLSRGAQFRLAAPREGLRSYLSVRGGVAVEPVLGSCATDLLSALGPSVVLPGDRFDVGAAPAEPPSGVAAASAPVRSTVRVLPGPRVDWFTDDAFERLVSTVWTVRPESDRIGLRLSGTTLTRLRTGELPSEPTLPGAVQVPPDGRPIIFGPDAPVTGGYPVIAVVADADFAALAQFRPGDALRLTR